MTDDFILSAPPPSAVCGPVSGGDQDANAYRSWKVCNCPSYFGTIWKILKGWVDPITAAKLVFLTPGEVYPALKEYIYDEDLPVSVGGKMEFEHGGPVMLGDAFKKALGRDQLATGPHKWVYDEKWGKSAVAVGSVDGKLRYEVVATLNGGRE